MKIPVLESLRNKVAGLPARNLIKKKTPTQVFSREISNIYKIFKSNYFEEHLRTAASVLFQTNGTREQTSLFV